MKDREWEVGERWSGKVLLGDEGEGTEGAGGW